MGGRCFAPPFDESSGRPQPKAVTALRSVTAVHNLAEPRCALAGTVDHTLQNAPKGELKFALAELSGTVCGAMIANWCRVFSQWQFRTRNVPGMGIIIARLLGVAMLLQALQPGPLDGATFRNPIDPRGQDPWVVQWEGQYLYCWSEGRIKISAARRLQDIAFGPATTIWTPPSTGPYSRNIWAPELHHVAGRWYVYFAADDGNNANHRMYVLGSVGSDPFGRYVFRGKISDPSDRWAIDGTVLQHEGKLYFIWSGWEGTVNERQNLYIAPMSNPWTISGERTLISQPTYAWERRGGPPFINEGPQVLVRNGKVHIIYSASGSWTDDYCLGRLTLTGADVLNPASWTKHATPVFSKTSQVFGPGHASFVKSPDLVEDWIVYHAAQYSGAGWTRDVRIQKFSWYGNGTPFFGSPITAGIHLVEPSGSPFGVTYEAEDAVVSGAEIVPHPDASGGRKVGYIDFSDSHVEFTANVATTGRYRLNIRYAAGLGAASHTVSVNATPVSKVNYPATDWNDWKFQTNTIVTLDAGANQIRLGKSGGFAELDFIGVNVEPDVPKVTPVLSWAPPQGITYGTSLSAAQLNATANAPGTFDYSPPAGTILEAGADQTLSVTFTPNDTLSYNGASETVQIDVAPASLTIQAEDRSRVFGAANPEFTATYGGFVNGDTAESLDEPVTFTTTATDESEPGLYPITPSGGSDRNYAITFMPGTLTITPAQSVELSAGFNAAREFVLRFSGRAGRLYRVETSVDLLSWSEADSLESSEGVLLFTDAESGEFPHRFYRVIETVEQP